jgi:hypothetical protein
MQIIRKAFKQLSKAKSIADVNNILTKLNVEEKYQMDDAKYPQIEFKITKDEIRELRNQGLLNESNLISNVSNQNTLTRLLYAIAWKNGDLKKIHHIVDGIESKEDDEKKNAFVFYQFGKYLTKQPGEPIIDQHVLRAYGIFKALKKDDKREIERLTTLSEVTKKEKNLIEDYKNWLKEGLSDELRKYEDYTYHVDKVLFALGKKVKVKK